MADSRAVYDPDRLPWLPDTRPRRRLSEVNHLLFWAFLAIVLVAGVSYWLGMKSVRAPEDFAELLGREPAPGTQPPAELADRSVPAPPAPQVEAPGLPDVSPIAEPRPVPIPGVDRARPAKPKVEPRATARSKQSGTKPKQSAERSAPAKKRSVAPPRSKLQAWPADQSANAYGRVVRVGTFYTRRQAKQGWARIVRVYPGMKRLRAVVVASPSLRNGRTFYRLQFGTTSQAHSEVLCQRMRVIGQSCVTVGLPNRGAG